MYEVAVEHTFAAGHALRDYHGTTEKVHGHNYRVQVVFEGAHLDPSGLLVDFVEVTDLLKRIAGRYDHEFMNEVPPFDAVNPSAENMARLFHDEITQGMAESRRENDVRVARVTVWETDTTGATYRG